MAQAELREIFLNTHIRGKLKSPLVQAAFERVDRRQFVPRKYRSLAYEDDSITIAPGSSISQPSLVAHMVDAANPLEHERVLEIGTASGFEAAILSLCSESVHTVEYNPGLAGIARRRLSRLLFAKVDVHTGDGTVGLPDQAPFDVIIASAALKEVPIVLTEQLSINGRMVLPVGEDPDAIRIVLLEKIQKGLAEQVIIPNAYFYPVISPNQGGWTSELLARAIQRKWETIGRLTEMSHLGAKALREKIATDVGIPPYLPRWKDLPLPDRVYTTPGDPIAVLVEQYPLLESFPGFRVGSL